MRREVARPDPLMCGQTQSVHLYTGLRLCAPENRRSRKWTTPLGTGLDRGATPQHPPFSSPQTTYRRSRVPCIYNADSVPVKLLLRSLPSLGTSLHFPPSLSAQTSPLC